MVINNITSIIYNTGLKSATEINGEFVVRIKEFEIIWEDIKTSTMQFPEQDYFIIGERGMGKTMLLAKIKYAVIEDKILSKWLIPIAYPEEQNNVTELYDLWLNTAAYLGEKHPELFENLSRQLEDLEINEATEEAAFKILNDTLNLQKKKLVLLIDNFDEILNNISEKENRRLREIVITNNNLRIIGASANAMEHNFRYDKAFYDHFIEIKLKGLSRSETEKLFKSKIGAIDNSKKILAYKQHKLEVLRQLSGGNIRSMIIFFNILLKNKKDSLMQDLEEVMESVTPYNLDKIKTLKNKQRKIIDFLAKSWDGTFVKDIAEGTRMKSNEVTAQLNALDQNQIVCAKNSSSRKKLYFIKDRFFNIWYLMRNSTLSNKNRVIWLVKVYESFYSKTELKHKRQNLLKSLKARTCSTFDIFYEAITLLYLKDYDYFQKIELHRELINYLQDENPSFLNYLPNIDEIIDINDEKRKKAVKEILNEVSTKEELIDRNYKDKSKRREKYLLITEGNYPKKERAEAFHQLGHIDQNEDFFLTAIKIGSKKAVYCIANYYKRTNNFQKAIKYFQKSKYNKFRVKDSIKNIIVLKRKLGIETSVISEYEDYYFNINKDSFIAHSLGHEYEQVGDLKKAEHYFKESSSENDYDAIECYLYFLFKNNIKKESAVLLSLKLYENSDRAFSALIYSMVQLWNDRIDKALSVIDKFLTEDFMMRSSYLITFFLLLISKKNYYLTKELFEKYELRYRLKPIWYTLMHYLKDEYPDEYLKMGSELKDTVEDMIERVEEMKIKYK